MKRTYPPRLKRRRGGLGLLSRTGLVLGMIGSQGVFGGTSDVIGIGWRIMAAVVMVGGFAAYIFGKD